MSMDSEGRISTYMGNCENYNPIKDKPQKVICQTLGQTYECSNFEYDENKDKTGFYAKLVLKGGKRCGVCKRYETKR